ncbi:hypothetical protein MWU75_13330 [Ornithinimicrobium sp. F0845]|uniref:hypothetical protein n=1 Tax=Ornithinimicrobium sp. F0845 TaxID=2926412 RepID=UPI001FF540FD|nr:hypothetical protein [Ornithinimicrobium sp. F0845]MCK0113126.1 hypothetical protein [Ornithinimicrobium sp. F0845]
MDVTSEDNGPGGAANGFVLGVLGASGGVGSTALATACAVRAAAAGREVVLVDAHPWSGGIEIMAGTDATPGLRWADLQGVRGDVDPGRLIAELPAGETGFRCLSWGPHPPGSMPPGPDPVLAAVRAAAEVAVIDLPRPGSRHQEWWSACSDIVLVVDASVGGIGAASVVAEAVSGLAGLVLRVPAAIDDGDLAAALGVPLLARLPVDRTVARCLDRGRAVASETGPLAEAADHLLAGVLPGLRAA